MPSTKEIGDRGEALAKVFLEQQQFRIVAQNWRAGRAEIDLIAWEGDVLVFVEVKARSSTHYGTPECFVSARKQRLLAGAATQYMVSIAYEWEIRFDIVSVIFQGKDAHRINHIRDAFFPGSN